MIRPASIVAVALLATGLASCGGSSAPHSTAAQGNPGGGTTPSPGGGTTPSSPAPFGPASPPAPEPHGHLSPAEYEAIKREYTLMQPLTNARDFSRAARRGRAACNALKVPNTTLVHLVQIDCNQALFYFGALDELVNARKRCGGATRTCIADSFLKLAIVTDGTVSEALRLNDELKRRGITGLCARSIGIRAGDVAELTKLGRAARDAAQALALGDTAAFARAERKLSGALGQGNGGPDPLKGIVRACKPPRAKATPPRPRRHPRLPGRDGIKA